MDGSQAPETTEPRGAAPAVRVKLLSGFEVLVDGEQVAVPWSAQRVVAYLALHDRLQPRSAVASALWLDLTDQRAAANLRTALWKLKELRDQLILARGDRLGIAERVEVDLAALLNGVRKLVSGPPSEDPEPIEIPIELDTLSGDLLPDWDEDWLLFERERLHQLRIHAIEALSGQFRRQGRYAEAVDAGLSAVAADPLRESAHRVLIEAHLAEGNVADARRQFERLRSALWESLGLLPSPALCRLVGVLASTETS
jgi:DNA-binding SARP family transcriptional activator